MAAAAIDKLKGAIGDLAEKAQNDKGTVAAIAGTAIAVGAGALLYRRYVRNAGPKVGELTPDTLPEGAYDAIIVGAGPSGSVCANYASRGGAKVALLDKATFPRGEGAGGLAADGGAGRGSWEAVAACPTACPRPARTPPRAEAVCKSAPRPAASG